MLFAPSANKSKKTTYNKLTYKSNKENKDSTGQKEEPSSEKKAMRIEEDGEGEEIEPSEINQEEAGHEMIAEA